MSATNFHQLYIFYTVAGLQSFSKAAEALHISQPAVSHQVSLLEQYYNQPLFDRLNRRIKLTPAGDIVLDYAQRIFALDEEMKRVLQDLGEVAFGRLILGASTTLGEYLLPGILSQFLERYPKVEVELSISNTQQITKNVLQQTLDLGFVGGPITGEDLVIEPFVSDEIVIIVSPKHPLTGRHDISMEELRKERFIVREKGSATRITAEDWLKKLDVELTIKLELASNEAVKQAVMLGLGPGILSRLAIMREEKSGQLSILNISGFHCSRQFSLIYRKDKRLISVEKAFLKMVQGMPQQIISDQ